MDDLRHRLIDECLSHVLSSFTSHDPPTNEIVQTALAEAYLWPAPLLQLSPVFEPGESRDEVIAAGELHEATRRTFAIKRAAGTVHAPMHVLAELG